MEGNAMKLLTQAKEPYEEAEEEEHKEKKEKFDYEKYYNDIAFDPEKKLSKKRKLPISSKYLEREIK